MKKKIAILGCGNMGGAIAASLPADSYSVVCTAATEQTVCRVAKDIPTAAFTLDNAAAVEEADIVVIAVKPFIFLEILPNIKPALKPGAIVISVIAGLTIADLDQMLDAREKDCTVVRVIPNTAIRNHKSVTFIAVGENVPKDKTDEVMEIFNRSGKAFLIPEKNMAACTALASCGIAFFLRFIRAAAEGGVELGLKPGFATEVAALTAEGAASLIADGSHPEVEIDKVTTPGGITIKGLNEMEAHGFTAAVIAALKATVK